MMMISHFSCNWVPATRRYGPTSPPNTDLPPARSTRDSSHFQSNARITSGSKRDCGHRPLLLVKQLYNQAVVSLGSSWECSEVHMSHISKGVCWAKSLLRSWPPNTELKGVLFSGFIWDMSARQSRAGWFAASTQSLFTADSATRWLSRGQLACKPEVASKLQWLHLYTPGLAPPQKKMSKSAQWWMKPWRYIEAYDPGRLQPVSEQWHRACDRPQGALSALLLQGAHQVDHLHGASWGFMGVKTGGSLNNQTLESGKMMISCWNQLGLPNWGFLPVPIRVKSATSSCTTERMAHRLERDAPSRKRAPMTFSAV